MATLRWLTAILVIAASASLDAQDDSAWQLYQIPNDWKRAPRGSEADKDGFGWYRCAVKIPAAWKGSDLEIYLEAIDDAREAYINGVRVGGFGQFPPTYRSGLGREQRFRVAADAVRAGEVNLVAIRVYKEAARQNFNVAAPVIFGPGEAIRLEGKWQFRSGDDAQWARTFGRAGPASDIVYDKLLPTEAVVRTLKKLNDDDGPLAVQGTLKRITVPDDLVIDVVLAEPVIGQPLSMKWDQRGRLWLVEYLQYPTPAGLRMVSRDTHLRTVYDQVPPPPPDHFRGADRITVHEDTNGDVRPDRHWTFVDGLSLVTSFALDRDGVWVLNPPYLLFYPDRNQDDRADGPPEVHLEGFGIEDSHSIANSLRWGPDGWLYACQGSTVTGNIKCPGTKDKPVHSMGQLIWRYHPERRQYEIFAEGGGNAFGLEIDSQGRIYSGHNGGDTRGFHYVQGGYFQKGFGKHGELSNPYAFGYFPHMPHHQVQRFTHAFVIYDSTELPQQYHGRLFGVGPLQSHVVMSQIEPHGSSFKTEDVGYLLESTDTWVRPVDIQVGPDGAIYVADFYEQRIDHSSHHQGRVHKESGRIYRLRPKGTNHSKRFDYSKLSSQQLVDVLGHENKWHRQEALRLIAQRKDGAILPLLQNNIVGGTGQHALESLWALNLCGGLTDAVAWRLLDHDDPDVRLWTVRLIGDKEDISDEIVAKLIEVARAEPNVEVRVQLACTARRLKGDHCLSLVRTLSAFREDSTDPYVPLLLWWAIESKCDSDRRLVTDLFADSQFLQHEVVWDHLLERVVRRYAQAGKRQDLLTCAKLLEAAPEKRFADRMLAGFEAAYEGRELPDLPNALAAAIAQTGGGSLALRLRQADPEAIMKALSLVADEDAEPASRTGYIRIFGQINHGPCVPVLLRLVRQSSSDLIRQAALSSLQAYDNPEIGTSAVQSYNNLSPDTVEVAQTLLASRSAWSLEFLAAVDSGKIKHEAVPLPMVRRMLLHRDDRIQSLVQKHWGQVQGATTDQMLGDIERLKTVLHTGSGNPYKGKVLYAKTCGKCHVLFGQGGFVGPDLTAYKRDDLHKMLLNVVNPSIEIREGFESYVLFTEDGRVLNGFIADQDNQVVEIKSVDGQCTIVPRSQIEEMTAIPRSIMPEGILSDSSDQQIRDLFAYLRATQPLP